MYKLRFSISILLSLLIILILSSFVIATFHDFNTYKKAINPSLELTLDRFHFLFKNSLMKEWARITAKNTISNQASSLKTFSITVDQENLDLLNRDLPSSGKEQYVDAYMNVNDDKKIRKIKLRYRGDNNYHWLYKQKSLRIKLGKGDTYNLEKKFNLMNPPHITYLRDYVYYKKSRDVGLISPDYFPVRVNINGQYMGVYAYLSQIDESLLRKHKLMPGSIYSGDKSPINNMGLPDLWFNAKYWDKKSSRNLEQRANREDIDLFINAVNNYTDSEFYDFVDGYIDKKQVFTYLALDRLYGSNHHDFSHNHRIYFDPYKGKYQFIAWDIRFWSGANEKDLSLYPFPFRVKKNSKFDAEIDKILFKLIKKGYMESSIDDYASMLYKHKNDIESDKYRDSGTWLPKLFPKARWYSTPYSYNDMLFQINEENRILQIRKKKLMRILNNAQVTYYFDKNKLYLKVNGNSPITMKFNNYYFSLYSSRKWINSGELKYKLLASKENNLVLTPKIYVLNMANEGIDPSKSLEFVNMITNKKITPNNIKFSVTGTPSELNSYKAAENRITLTGVNKIRKTTIFNKNTIVKIEKGTTFVMDYNTSIYFYGKVMANGTNKKPIKFIAKDPKKPWGIVAVQGKATTGSKFEYVQFENGSIDTRNLIHYTSPFNIHDMNWFEVRHCKIGRNFVGDDAMHIAYAKGIVDNTEFIDARSDGLDIDISDVTITNNIFYKSGNDGLDIMTTTMNASNNIFIDTGDKGISVGEWSEAVITDSLFLRTGIGLEVKDKSKVKANNLVIVDAKDKAINLYNKNKRYDEGGRLEGGNIVLIGNTKVKTDKCSAKKIKHRVENTLPDLKQYKWHENLQNTRYKKFINDIKLKYAQ